jgi:hypothetical protein
MRQITETQVGDNFAMAPDSSPPPSQISLQVKYTSNMQGISQEGLVELVHRGDASSGFGLVIVNVLISA